MSARSQTVSHQSIFDDLLTPVSAEAFLNHYWEKDSLLLTGRPTRGGGCVTLRDVESLAYSLQRCERDWLRLIKDGKELPESVYSTRESMVDLAKVWRAYDSGYTIQLSKLHKRSASVATLCRGIELALMRAGVLLTTRTGAHLYLTPAGSQGFERHYDYHDVFVLQIEGRKHWRVHEWSATYPLERRSRDAVPEIVPPVKHDVVLEPGDLLYIPRGAYHDARAADEYSLHITFSVFPATWIDLARRLMTAECGLRAPLPPGLSNRARDPEGVASELKTRLLALTSTQAVVGAVRQLVEDYLAAIDAVPAEGLSQWGGEQTIAANTELCTRAGMLACCVTEGETARLLFQGSALKGPAALAPTFEFIATHDHFWPDDLPGPLSTDMKLQVVRALVSDGLLMRAVTEHEDTV